jgi:tetratricopeptide (TPR) repeat protein
LRLTNGSLDLALLDYEEAARLDPNLASVHYGRGQVYLAGGYPDEAAACYTQAIECAPDAVEGYFERGRCLLRAHRFEEALTDATRAIELDPSNPDPRRLRTEVALRTERLDDAAIDVAELARLTPNHPQVHYLRGKLEYRRERFEAALEELTVAVTMCPTYGDALGARGGVFRALERHAEALADLAAAAQHNPRYAAEYLVQRGIVSGSRGEFDLALADLVVALQINPGKSSALRARERVLSQRDSSPPVPRENPSHRSNPADDTMSGTGLVPALRVVASPKATKPTASATAPAPAARPAGAAASTPAVPASPDRSVVPASHALEARSATPRPPAVLTVVHDAEPENEFEFETKTDLAQATEPGLTATDLETISDDFLVLDLEVESSAGDEPPAVAARVKTQPTPPKSPPFELVKPVDPPRTEKTRPIPPKSQSSAPTKYAEPPRPTPQPLPNTYQPDEYRQKGIVGKYGKIVLLPTGLVVIVGLILASVLGDPKKVNSATTVDDGFKVSHKLTADEYWKQFAKDNRAANVKFNELFVEVTGKIKQVNSDPSKNTILLETSANTLGIECQFASKDALEGVTVGDQVVVVGLGTTRPKLNTDVVLMKCRFRR